MSHLSITCRLAGILSLVVISISQLAHADDSVGFVNGSFAVSETGAATYSIPIEVPPGVNGMQPSVAFIYDSQSGDGNMGRGWGLSGLAGISRCPTNIEEDGSIDGVDFDENDMYCFNGRRLIYDQVKNSYFLGDGSNTTIETYGNYGSGPEYFRVTEGGITSYFGKVVSQSGAVEDVNAMYLTTDGSEVVTWLIANREDHFGNGIKYTYDGDSKIGVHRLHLIEYSNYSIKFEWSAKDSETTISPKRMLANKTLSNGNYFLKSVSVFSGDEELYKTNLNYENQQGLLQLSSLEKCNNLECFTPVRFGWENLGQMRFQPYQDAAGTRSSATKFYLGDFNGDGCTDYVYQNYEDSTNNGAFRVALSNCDGSFAPYINAPGSRASSTKFYLGDFNGDGCTDYVYQNHEDNANNGAFRVALSNCDGSFAPYINAPGTRSSATQFYLGDFNGDGCTDYVYQNYEDNANNGAFRVALSNCDGSFAPYINAPGSRASSTKFHLGDFNGDGCTDYVYQNHEDNASNGAFRVALSNCDGSFAPYINAPGTRSSATQFYLGDFNGDSCTDYVYQNHEDNANNGAFRVALSNCDGSFAPYINAPGSRASSTKFHLGDFNGDGCTDYVYQNHEDSANNGAFRVALSYCDGSFAPYINAPGSRASSTKFHLGDFNGDGTTDYVYQNYQDGASNGAFRVSLSDRNDCELEIISISSRSNEEIKIRYVYLSDKDSNYMLGEPSPLGSPNVRAGLSARVVKSIFSQSSANTYRTMKYLYSDLRVHRLGLGLLGFHDIESIDGDTGIRTITTYSQDWQKRTTGMVESTQTIAPDGVTVLSESVNQLENHFEGVYDDRYLPYIKTSTTVQRDLDGSIINTTTLENELNEEGWAWHEQTCVTSVDLMSGVAGDMSQNSVITCALMPNKETHKETYYDYYSKAESGDFAPLLRNKSTTVTIPDAPPFQPASETRVVEYEYYLDTGKVMLESLEPDNAALTLTKTHTYHSSGQIETTTVSGPDFASRTTRVEYDPVTLRPVRQYDAMNHYQSFEYGDSRFPWLATKVTAQDGSWSKSYFNSWGEKSRTESGHGSTLLNWSTADKEWCDGNAMCQPDELFYTVTDSATGEPVYVYFDQLGREVRKQWSGLHQGQVATIFQNTEYNARGLVVWAGQPYFAGEADQYGTETTYDDLGRPIAIQSADQQTSSIEYAGREAVYINPLGHKKTVIKNALGQQIEVRDNRNNAITYGYDAFGNMVYMRDPNNNETKIGYNIRGFKTLLDDPDQGVWEYTYDALGQMIEQKDAIGQITHTEYDILGRMVSRTDRYGKSDAETSNWIYYGNGSPATSIGKLQQVTNNDNYVQTYTYDAFGRPSQTSTLIDGTLYTASQSYDSFGRALDTTYPTGYAVRNRYHSVLGSLTSIVRADGDTNPDNDYVFWKAESQNARGQLEYATLGAQIGVTQFHNAATGMVEDITAKFIMTGAMYQDLNYEWDAVGNLQSFVDARQSVSETYGYDDLNRLLTVNATNGMSTTDYDELGNITSKSGVGAYSYSEVSVPSECTTQNHAAGPHAVRRITGSQANYFCYDKNGNLVKDKNRTLAYTGFNKPHTIMRGTKQVDFEYGPSRARFKREDRTSGSLSSTTIYLGNYEKVTDASGTQHKINIGGVAQVIEKANTTTVNYLLKDHLGSITAIVNQYGTVMEEMSFDAWGNRREPTNLNLKVDPLAYKNPITDRGFTGHEHIDSVGLIHMNGRVYDPVIGRFLSADPIVQAPSNLQSLNRYSYVMNNPLSLIDPSGYASLSKIWKQTKDRAKRWGRAISTFAVTGNFMLAHAAYNYQKARDFGYSSKRALEFGAKAASGPVLSAGLAYLTTGNPFAAARAYAAALIMSTPKAQSAVDSLAKEYFDDFLGINSTGISKYLASTYIQNGVEFSISAFSGMGVPQANTSPSGSLATNAESWHSFITKSEWFITAKRYYGYASDFLDKVVTSPNTIIGLAVGGAGHVIGELGQLVGYWSLEPSIGFGNNAIQFTGNPFAAGGAITLGNSIVWGQTADSSFYSNTSGHEMNHTYQAQKLGPLYIPMHALGMISSTASYPFSSLRRTVPGASFVHGKLNFMEGHFMSESLY